MMMCTVKNSEDIWRKGQNYYYFSTYYGYDYAGNLVIEQSIPTSESKPHIYDASGRLISADIYGNTPHYEYDKLNNLTKMTLPAEHNICRTIFTET